MTCTLPSAIPAALPAQETRSNDRAARIRSKSLSRGSEGVHAPHEDDLHTHSGSTLPSVPMSLTCCCRGVAIEGSQGQSLGRQKTIYRQMHLLYLGRDWLEG